MLNGIRMDSLKILVFDTDKEFIFLQDRAEIEYLEFIHDENGLIDRISSNSYDTAIVNAGLYKDNKRILKRFIDKKIPVLIALDKPANIEDTIDGLFNGAFDYFSKPTFSIMNDNEKERKTEEIITKIIFAQDSKDKITPSKIKIDDFSQYNFNQSLKKLVIIGSSTGGPQSLERIIPLIPKEIPSPVIIVQHMPEQFTEKFAERLDNISLLKVKEAEHNEELKQGVCYVAKGNYHLELGKKGSEIIITLNQKEKIHGTRPSIDITMQSACRIYGKNLLGIILTGMGTDGTIGAKRIKEKEGTILVQSEKTSIIFGMPKSVIASGYYDEIVDLEKIPVAMMQILEV